MLGNAIVAAGKSVAARIGWFGSASWCGPSASEDPQHRIVPAFGQHDADRVGEGGRYAYHGDLFANVPSHALDFKPESFDCAPATRITARVVLDSHIPAHCLGEALLPSTRREDSR